MSGASIKRRKIAAIVRRRRTALGYGSGPHIALAIGETLPALLAVEAGDAYAAALPPDVLDTDRFRVVGDDTGRVIDVILEWRKLGSEDWQAEANATREDDGTVTVRHLPPPWLASLTREANGTITVSEN